MHIQHQVGILCFSFPAWNGNYTKSTVELMKACAASVPVLYIDYAYTWKDVLQGLVGRHPHIPLWRVLGIRSRLRTTHSGVALWSLPPTLPINRLPEGSLWRLLWAFNCVLIRRSLQRAARRWGVDDFVCVNALQPLYHRALHRAFPTRKQYYYCYDDVGSTHYTQQHGARLEKSVLANVCGLICSSQGLLRQKGPLAKATRVVPNGVAASFLEATYRVRSEAQKRVGYVGAIDHRLDLDLLECAFRSFPEIDFVFLGRVSQAAVAERLSAYPNVLLAGTRPYVELPQHLSQFDVGIIPFLRTPFTACIYPMKINEYLAVGLPVVSTNFGDMREFGAWAHLADSTDSFLEGLAYALEPQEIQNIQARKTFAAQQTWAGRAECLMDFLGLGRLHPENRQSLPKKGRRAPII